MLPVLSHFARLRRLLLHPAVSGSAWAAAGAAVTGVLNFVTSVLLAREFFLGASGYGALAALLAFASFLGVVNLAVALAVSHRVAALGDPARGAALLRPTVRAVGLCGLGGGGLVLLFLPALVALTRAPPAAVALLAPLLLVGLLIAIVQGVLQGRLAFPTLGLLQAAGAGARLVFSLILVRAGSGVTGGLAAVVLASVLVLWLSRVALGRSTHGLSGTTPAVPGVSPPRLSVLAVFVALLGITALFSADILVAQHFLPSNEAGLYSGLSLLARSIYYASLPFTVVMMPLVARPVWGASRQRRASLLVTGGLVVGVAAGFTFLAALVPVPLIRFTLGATYLSAAPSLLEFAVFLSLVTIAAWGTHALLAAGARWSSLLPVSAAGLQLVLLLQWHGSRVDILRASTVAAACFLGGVVLLGLTLRASRLARGPFVNKRPASGS